MALLAGCTAVHQPMGPAVQQGHIVQQTLVAADGARLPLRSWLPDGGAEPRAVILALHGMNDYSHAFDMAAAYWAERGVATYAYDQRGFGASARPGIWPDTATLAADLDAAAHAVAKRHPGLPLYLLGESMGGAVTVAALAASASTPAPAPAPTSAPTSPRTPALPSAHVPGIRPPLAQRVQGAILSAPALWGRQTMSPLYRALLWVSYRTVPAMAVRPPATLKIQPSDNIAMLQALGRDPLVLKRTRIDAIQGMVDLMSSAYDDVARLPRGLPILAMYGMHEQVLDRPAVSAAIDRLQEMQPDTRIRLAVYPQGYHMLLRDRCARIVWDDVLAWLDDPRAGLPSGAEGVAWQEEPQAASPCPTDVALPAPSPSASAPSPAPTAPPVPSTPWATAN